MDQHCTSLHDLLIYLLLVYTATAFFLINLYSSCLLIAFYFSAIGRISNKDYTDFLKVLIESQQNFNSETKVMYAKQLITIAVP